MNIGSLGQDNIEKYGECEKTYSEGKWYTNVEIQETTPAASGNALKSLGVQRGRVAIQMPNSPW